MISLFSKFNKNIWNECLSKLSGWLLSCESSCVLSSLEPGVWWQCVLHLAHSSRYYQYQCHARHWFVPSRGVTPTTRDYVTAACNHPDINTVITIIMVHITLTSLHSQHNNPRLYFTANSICACNFWVLRWVSKLLYGYHGYSLHN